MVIPFSLASRPKPSLGSSPSTTLVHYTSPSRLGLLPQPAGYTPASVRTSCSSFCGQQPEWAYEISRSPPSPAHPLQCLRVKSILLAKDYQVGGLLWPTLLTSTRTLSPLQLQPPASFLRKCAKLNSASRLWKLLPKLFSAGSARGWLSHP